MFGTFDKYICGFTNGQMIDHPLESGTDIKSTNELSDNINKDMKNYGFKFCGSITIYSFWEGIGIFNDHWEHCEFR